MPLFDMSRNDLESVEQTNFSTEKDLQTLIEKNLSTVFNCRFVATEFSTGIKHGGRIDTLALSEDGNPVIIEYKKAESSELITQSLFYLDWIYDHKGDFERAVQRTLGPKVEVDWSDTRVICIAPNYRKYDIHAVQVMGANIELWKYRLFKNNSLYLEVVFQADKNASNLQLSEKNLLKSEAARKAAQTRGIKHTFEEHLKSKPKEIQDLINAVREYTMGLDPSIDEIPRKRVVAYKTSQNILCILSQAKNIKLYVKLNPKDIQKTVKPKTYRDVSNISHAGTGSSEFTISTKKEFEEVKPFIELAYNKIGG